MIEFDVSHESNKQRASKHPLIWLVELVLQHKFVTVFVLFGIIIHQSLRFIIPLLIGMLVDEGIETGDLDRVVFFAVAVLIAGLISPIFDATMSWGNEYLAASVERDVRSIYFQSLQAKNMAYHDSTKIGELLAVSQNDMRSLYSTLAPGIRVFGEAIVSIITLIVIIFLQHWLLGVIFVLIMPLWVLSLKWYNNRLTPVSVSQQTKFRDLSAQVQENLMGAEVVRAFNQENRELNSFRKENDHFTNIWEERGKVTALYFPMLMTYFIGGMLFISSAYLSTRETITFFGLNIEANLSLGSLVTMVGLIIQLRGPTFLLGRVLEFTSLGLAGVRKVQTVIGEDSSLEISDHPVYNEIQGHLKYEGVSFGYNGESVLKNITFEVKPGEIVAIVGPTGSGKTTLLKLLTRLYDPSEGTIYLDGIDLRDYDLKHLRSSIASVEQDIYLFSTSIRENITFAAEDKREIDLKEVLSISRVDEFVNDLQNGVDTRVGERGMRLSGGQRQRIGIARAFLIEPKILVLDDSTSAVDSQTEQEIVSAIKNIMRNRTSFVITARLNMIRQADKILVIDKGEIIGSGSHEELLSTNEIYRRIFDPHVKLKEENRS